VINTITMKIRDIILEDVDMSWWREQDALYNPTALDYANKQVKRDNIINKDSKGTKVFTKPVRKSQAPFSNVPKQDDAKSPGYTGNVDVKVRAGHIDKDEGNALVK